MDISDEIANIHMKTDAKNLVTAARTIHFPDQKETIHMMRKEACSGSIHDTAHIPNQNCLADCLTKASAKADNLITALKTGKMLTFTLILEQLWNEDFTEESMKQNLSAVQFLSPADKCCIFLLLGGVALPSSRFVTMTVPMPHWDVKSDSLPQDDDSL